MYFANAAADHAGQVRSPPAGTALLALAITALTFLLGFLLPGKAGTAPRQDLVGTAPPLWTRTGPGRSDAAVFPAGPWRRRVIV